MHCLFWTWRNGASERENGGGSGGIKVYKERSSEREERWRQEEERGGEIQRGVLEREIRRNDLQRYEVQGNGLFVHLAQKFNGANVLC